MATTAKSSSVIGKHSNNAEYRLTTTTICTNRTLNKQPCIYSLKIDFCVFQYFVHRLHSNCAVCTLAYAWLAHLRECARVCVCVWSSHIATMRRHVWDTISRGTLFRVWYKFWRTQRFENSRRTHTHTIAHSIPMMIKWFMHEFLGSIRNMNLIIEEEKTGVGEGAGTGTGWKRKRIKKNGA